MSWGGAGHRLRYFLEDAWDEWRHSPGVNLLAVGTLAATLFLAGLVMLVLTNVQGWVDGLRSDLRVEVYLADEVSPDRLQALNELLQGQSGVARVEYVDKDEALRRYREFHGDDAGVLDNLDPNPLPASLDVYLLPGAEGEAAAARLLETMPGEDGVESVQYDRELVQQLSEILRLARVGGLGLAVLVFAIVAWIIASVLRLAAHARRDEIEIMLLVGATPTFVRGPFLVAALVQGMLASGFALVLLEAARRSARTWLGGDALVTSLLVAQPLGAGPALALALVGIVVGLVGAWFAVRPSL